MAEMRELSKLFFCFRSLSGSEERMVEDMFRREHLLDLVEALKQLTTTSDKQEKHGQKLFLDAVLLRSVKTLEGYFAQTMQDTKKKELKNFRSAYKSLQHELFPSARQKCIKNSLETNRKPASLPNEQKVLQLKEFIATEISFILKNYTVKNFAYLRSLVVARLTLFNARRGEEASRMLFSEWEEAEKGTWLPDEELEKIKDHAEQYLLGHFKLAYLKGKGKKYVPVLIPNDLMSAIQVLKQDRSKFGIREDNPFLFATKNGLSHCSGWHAVAEVCAEAGINIITATKMRHRLSSIYASLDMSPENRKIFLQHMGHEEQINRENYQCPLGIRTACIMGKMLSSVDEGSVSELHPKGPSTAPEEDLMYKPCKSGSPNELDVSPQECSFEIEDDDGAKVLSSPVTAKKTKSSSVKWSKDETEAIKCFFRSYIFDRKENNTGNLPSKREVQEFLEKHDMHSLEGLSEKTKLLKIRSKIFNERKTMRLMTLKKLDEMKSLKI